MELTNERITKKFGSGIVTGEKGEVLDVRFDTGEQKRIGLWICIENGLIQLEDEEKQRELEALQKEREARKEEERKAEEPHKTKTEEKRKERDKAEATGEKKGTGDKNITNYKDLGIVGETIVCKEFSQYKARPVNDRELELIEPQNNMIADRNHKPGDRWAICPLTNAIYRKETGAPGWVCWTGTPYWTYNGETIESLNNALWHGNKP